MSKTKEKEQAEPVMATNTGEGKTDPRETSFKWENADTGDFLIHNFNTDGPLIAEFRGITNNHPLTDEKTGISKDMLEFVDTDQQRVLIDPSYKLYNALVNKEIYHKDGSPLDWSKRIVFRIEKTGEKKIEGGKKLSLFSIKFAYSEA